MDYTEVIKTSMILRVSGRRFEFIGDISRMYDHEAAMDMASDIYRPYDDPEEDDSLDIEVTDIKHLAKLLDGLKSHDMEIFIATNTEYSEVSSTLDTCRLSSFCKVDNSKVSESLQGRIDKAIEALKP